MAISVEAPTAQQIDLLERFEPLASAQSFSDIELAALGNLDRDPKRGMVILIDAIIDTPLDNSAPTNASPYQDFQRFAGQYWNVSLETSEPNFDFERALRDAGQTYVDVEESIQAYCADIQFTEAVSDNIWDTISNEQDIVNRLELVGTLYEQYERGEALDIDGLIQSDPLTTELVVPPTDPSSAIARLKARRLELVTALATGAVFMGGHGAVNLASSLHLPAPGIFHKHIAKAPSARSVAAKKFHIDPNQTIPKADKQAVVQAGIAAARDTASKHDGSLDRSNVTVRRVDAMVRYSMHHLQHETITPTEVDAASQQAAQVMIAARDPKNQTSNTFIANNRFQKKAIHDVQPLLEHGNAYTHTQAHYLAGLVVQSLDANASPSNHASTLNGLLAVFTETGHSTQPGKKGSYLLHNPRYSVAQYIAATTIRESGTPANPRIYNYNNTCYGILQNCIAFWPQRAETYLGNRNADIHSIKNQLEEGIKEWSHALPQIGSGEAQMASWIEGTSIGQKIAGTNKQAYEQAMGVRDGNGTSVRQYVGDIDKLVGEVNIDKQLPFLKKVMKEDPGFDWSLLRKKYPLYSQLHMQERRAAAHRARSHSRHTVTRLHGRAAAKGIVSVTNQMYQKEGNRNLETTGNNSGPRLVKYTHGNSEPWCADFVSWVAKQADVPFPNHYSLHGRIPAVAGILRWSKEDTKHAIHFSENSTKITPRAGDFIMFDRNEHVGVVMQVKGKKLTYVSGNSGRSVNAITKNTLTNYRSSGSLDFARVR